MPRTKNSLRDLERQAVVTSLENLLTFPFIVEARKKQELSLHGLWTDIGEGEAVSIRGRKPRIFSGLTQRATRSNSSRRRRIRV